MKRINEALRLFKTECNCAQSVLLAFVEDLDINKETAKKVSSPFGGGIGRSGMICGAVSGALMVLGIKYGDKLSKDNMYKQTREFLNMFKQEYGQIDCKLLTGFDLSIPEQSAEAGKQNIADNLCSNYIKKSVMMLERILTELG